MCVLQDPAEGNDVLPQVYNRKCTAHPSKVSSRIFARTYLGLQTGVVPKLIIVHPGHSVHQKIANETLWKEKVKFSFQEDIF